MLVREDGSIAERLAAAASRPSLAAAKEVMQKKRRARWFQSK